jgi:ATP-binding protein involved in chromosome partitioning
MSWFTPAELPENKYYIFGKGGCKQLAEELDVALLGEIPLVQSICESGDSGVPVSLNEQSMTALAFDRLADNFILAVDKRNKEMSPTEKVEVHKR